MAEVWLLPFQSIAKEFPVSPWNFQVVQTIAIGLAWPPAPVRLHSPWFILPSILGRLFYPWVVSSSATIDFLWDWISPVTNQFYRLPDHGFWPHEYQRHGYFSNGYFTTISVNCFTRSWTIFVTTEIFIIKLNFHYLRTYHSQTLHHFIMKVCQCSRIIQSIVLSTLKS